MTKSNKWTIVQDEMEKQRVAKDQAYKKYRRSRTTELQLAADEADKLMDMRTKQYKNLHKK